MRLKITCQINSSNLSVNYNYGIFKAIQKLLRIETKELNDFLYESGYLFDLDRFNLFTFSLRFEKMRMNGPIINLLSQRAYLYVSFPIIGEFLMDRFLRNDAPPEMEVTIENDTTEFKVLRIDVLPEPEITDSMKFILLSPMVLSVKKQLDGRYGVYYLRPEDMGELNKQLSDNLSKKYALNNKLLNYTGQINVEWEKDYTEKHSRITKKITVENPFGKSMEIIGILSPFTISGDTNLIKTGLECGFGEKTYYGLGMAEVIL